MHLREELACRYDILARRLEDYESVGIVRFWEHLQLYDSELKVSVIAKAERLGFTFDEIVMFFRVATRL